MNLRAVRKHIRADMNSGIAVLLKGPPGVGKTDLMKVVFDRFCLDNPGKKIGYACTFMATQSVVGATGLPWKGERMFDGKPYVITDPAVPEWFLATDPTTGETKPADLFDKVFYVTEEWGQGALEVKRLYAEVFYTGACGKWKLPVGSPRIALTNVDASDGITKDFDFIVNRRAEYEVTGDVEVWLDDFADHPYDWEGKTYSVMALTKSWAKQNPLIMYGPKPQKQGPWATQRSVTAWDRYAQNMADPGTGKIDFQDSYFIEASAGKIGMPATQSICEFAQFALELPSYEDIVADPTGTPVPAKADLLMLMSYQLAGIAKREDLDAVLKYAGRMPKGMTTACVKSLLRRDYNLLREPSVNAWTTKNAALIGAISALTD